MKNIDILIIGSGLGGLICGNILSREGFSVCVLEKQQIPGGNLQSFVRHGHSFDTGVHYIGSLGEGQPLNRYWKYLGLSGAIPLKQLDLDGFDMIRFGDDEFPLAQNTGNFTDQLIPFFPGCYEVLESYMEKLRVITESSLLYNLEVPGTNDEEQYRSAGAMDYYLSLAGSVKSAKSGIPLSAILAGNNYLYAGSEATPLHMAAMINHSFISGAYRVVGGSSQIAELLVKNMEARGGTLLNGKKVANIRKIRQKFQIETHDGEMFLSSIVISGIHPQKTMQMMKEDMVRSSYRRRLSSLGNTPGSFILHLSLKPGVFPYFNRNYHVHEGTDVWRHAAVGSPGSMFFLSTQCDTKNQEFADTATVLAYDNYHDYLNWEHTTVGKRGNDYLDLKQLKAEKLLQAAERSFPALKGAIDHMDISTPLTYRDYTGTPDGSLYGIIKDYRDTLMTTLTPRTKIPNFYFTGQNINLHGVLGVTIGAVMTCGEILGIDSLLKKIKNG